MAWMVLAIGASVAAQATQAAPGQAPVLVRREAPKPVVEGSDTCLPLQLSGALPVITATLGGRSLKFGFDTGAPGGPHINPTILDQLKAPQIGEARVSDPSLKNPVAVGIFEISDLKLGKLTVAKWQATGHPPRPDRLGEPDGIIGLDSFSGYVVTVDYPGGRLLATKGRLPEPDGRTSFRYEGSIPRVPLTIEGKAIDAHIDTGNSRYPLIVPEAYAAQLSGFANRFPIGIARSVNNKFDLMAQPVSDAKVGDIPLYASTAAFPAPAARGNIGSQLLRDFVLKVDPANRIVALERARPGLENGCPNA